MNAWPAQSPRRAYEGRAEGGRRTLGGADSDQVRLWIPRIPKAVLVGILFAAMGVALAEMFALFD